MSNKLKEKLANHIVIFDGAIGTEIYKHNIFINSSFEELCLSRPELIADIHQEYYNAGAEVLTTNSFGANANKLAQFGLGDKVREINIAAAKLARENSDDETLIAGSVGPIGMHGGAIDSDEKIIAMLTEQLQALLEGGADFILFESLATLKDIEYVAKIVEQQPAFDYMVSFAVNRELELQHGRSLLAVFKLFTPLANQPLAIGLNCGSGAEEMLSALEILMPSAPCPVVSRPNAGLPKSIDNRIIYMTSPEYFTTYAMRYVNLGVHGIGGCCGTGPEHIAEMAKSIKPLTKQKATFVAGIADQETEVLPPVPNADKSKFAAKIVAGEWVTSIEITPPRGFDLSSTIEKAKQCREAGIDAINIPDGPRASSRVSPIVTAYEIQQQAGIEAVLHCCCRDKNLIGMQADLLGCAWQQINNILFITGDPPKLGDYPFASAVFDVDAIGILQVVSQLNRGIDVGGKSIGKSTPIFAGAGADPNAIDMKREYRRLREKVAAGAEYIITQPVFAVKPLLDFMDNIADLNTPVIAGIWPLASYRNAEFMKNEVPGVVVPDEIMERMAAADTREEQRAVGIAIAKECVEQIRHAVQGIQVSAPFGNVQTAIAVIDD
ncbi:MAG: bifunctional homocysteine S-methyltransferase/methylenetetrahydrofolate reductase [Victivallaceae bacterium]|nr:bifunctional homocysteine S-methyltransferase/methylenetetrahydrofolate reductase [Victivallaceae bacterium]